jgi:hypothetical protein
MIAGGMAEGKVIRVVGQASTVLFDKQDPFNPQNRRIGIVVSTRKPRKPSWPTAGKWMSMAPKMSIRRPWGASRRGGAINMSRIVVP